MSAADRDHGETPPERSDDPAGGEAAAPTLPAVTPIDASHTELFPVAADAIAAAAAVAAGARIGRYEIRRVVGAGGMGLVVAGHDPELGRTVAIKLLAREHAEARARLIREAQAMAKLSHPNVVTVHEVLRLGDRAAIVMELVEGADLGAWRDAAPRTWREIVAAYVQAARGLAAAHRAGMVHRDFKPSNALIDRDGIVRVTDFGLVHAAGDAATTADAGDRDNRAVTDSLLTRTGAVIGTPAYMAPEQHRGDPVDARTDQWALACSLYGALYGQRAFAGETYAELSAAVLAGRLRPEPASARVPPRIRAAIRKALALAPDQRYPSVDDLIAALTPPRRTWPIAVGIAAVAAAAAAVVVLATRGDATATCDGLDAPLAAAWNPDRAGAIRARFAAANVAYGADAAEHAIAGLDAYGKTWSTSRVAACVQHRQGIRSAEQLKRQVSCLDQRLVEVGAVVGALVDAEAKTIRVAGDAVDGLHPVGDCADARDTVPRPASAEARADIARAENTLARGYALAELAQFEQATPLAAEVAAVGERTGWAPLSARALLLLGRCQSRTDEKPIALPTYERAATAAARAGDDAGVAEALASRFYTIGEPLGRPADAIAIRSFVELALERAGNPWRLRALWLHNLAIILLRIDDTTAALAAETEAIELWRRNLPPGHFLLIDSLETEANIEIYRKEFDHAAALFAEALAAATTAYGPNHPKIASLLLNQGVLEAQRGDLPAAVTYWEKALAIETAAGVPRWSTPFNLSIALHDLGRWSAAVPAMDSALAGAEAQSPGDTLPIAYVTVTYGALLTSIGELDRAGEMLARGLRAARASGTPSMVADGLGYGAQLALDRGDLAAARAALAAAAKEKVPEAASIAVASAEVVAAGGDCAAARPLYQRGIEAAIGEPSESEVTRATLGLARCQLALGAAGDAVTALEARLAWFAANQPEPAALADLQLVLAQALVASGGDRARARSLAESARTGFATLGTYGAKRAAEVDRWLRTH